jgi:hypothetical protein
MSWSSRQVKKPAADALPPRASPKGNPPQPPPIDLTPIYCRHCGAALIHYAGDAGYDSYTGERRTYRAYRCPNQKWWNLESHS